MEQSIESKDINRLYGLLCSIEPHRWNDLLISEKPFANLLLSASLAYPLHIRLKSIEAIGLTNDKHVAHYIQVFLNDNDQRIVRTTIEALKNAGSFVSSERIIEIFRSSNDVYLRNVCLEYFGSVEAQSYAQKLSILSICIDMNVGAANDPGLEWPIVKASANQVKSDTDKRFVYLLGKLNNYTNSIRRLIRRS